MRGVVHNDLKKRKHMHSLKKIPISLPSIFSNSRLPMPVVNGLSLLLLWYTFTLFSYFFCIHQCMPLLGGQGTTICCLNAGNVVSNILSLNVDISLFWSQFSISLPPLFTPSQCQCEREAIQQSCEHSFDNCKTHLYIICTYTYIYVL